MPKDSHVQAVRRKLKERSAKGLLKYGTTLDRQDLSISDWLHELQCELLDAACYVERLLGDVRTLDALYPRVLVSTNLEGTDPQVVKVGGFKSPPIGMCNATAHKDHHRWGRCSYAKGHDGPHEKWVTQ